MESKFIVLGIERDKRFEKGEIVDRLWAYYFKPDLSNSRIFKGFVITKIDILGRVSAEDFPTLPGVYIFKYAIVKSQPEIRAVTFIEPFTVSGDDLLMLSIRPGEFQTEDKQVKKGLNCHYLDPSGYSESGDILGFIPSRAWIDRGTLDLFPQIPAYYQFGDISHAKDRRGDAVIKLSAPSLIKPYSKEVSAA